jgi:hypothetical protein
MYACHADIIVEYESTKIMFEDREPTEAVSKFVSRVLADGFGHSYVALNSLAFRHKGQFYDISSKLLHELDESEVFEILSKIGKCM